MPSVRIFVKPPPLAVGLIGAGGITHVHVPAWLELGAQVTVFSQAGAAELAAEYGVNTAASLEELLAGCDIVDICTPTPTHRSYAEAALLAGKDVICEKPIALTRADADAVSTLAEQVGRRVYPAHVVRFFPEYARAKSAVSDGQIGVPAISRFSRIGEYPRWSAWFGDDSQSGGIVMDQMIHDLDIARWISGEVTDVYAVKSASTAGPTVTAQVTLTHEGGALSYISGVWGAPGTTFVTSFSIAGSHGVLRYDSRENSSIRFDGGPRKKGGGTRPETVVGESPYLTQLREFANSYSGGKQPRVSLEDGARAVELAEAANESIATGTSVCVAHRTAGGLS
jgi:predicted dehydrogenase